MDRRRFIQAGSLAAGLLLESPSARADTLFWPAQSSSQKIGTVGIFVNPASGGIREQLIPYRAWLGRDVKSISTNIGTPTSMPGLVTSTLYTVDSILAAPGVYAIVALPMITYDKWDSLSQAASGAYHWWFDPIADTLLRLPGETVNVRLGWEFDLASQPWCATGKEVAYVAAWRTIVDGFRKRVGGEAFRFHWCPSITGWPKCNVQACYPGDDYVDVVGCDLYDAEAPNPAGDTSAGRWRLNLNGAASGGNFGLAWLTNFAKMHKKPLTFHEAACGLKGDNPHFVRQLAAYAAANSADVYWWESDSSYPGRLATGERPLSGTAFKAAFGPVAMAS